MKNVVCHLSSEVCDPNTVHRPQSTAHSLHSIFLSSVFLFSCLLIASCSSVPQLAGTLANIDWQGAAPWAQLNQILGTYQPPAPDPTNPSPAVAVAEVPIEPQNGFADETIQWMGSYRCHSPVESILKSASVSGGKVKFSFSSYSWPANGDGGCDAVVCLFLRQADGAWKGGKFDWIRKGGQSVKTLENVHGGYGGHTVPAVGTPVAFVWGRCDGKGRSNAVFTEWR